MPLPDPSPLEALLPSVLPGAFRQLIRPFTTEGVTSTPFVGGTLHHGTMCETRADAMACHHLGDLPKGQHDKLAYRGMTFLAMSQPQMLSVADRVSVTDRLRHIPDGRTELTVPPGGLRLVPDAPLDGIVLHLATLAPAQIDAVTFGLRGAVLAQASAQDDTDAPVRLELMAEGIAWIEVKASDKTLLLRLCPLPEGTRPPPPPPATLPMVRSRTDGAWSDWPATVLDRFSDKTGRECVIVAHDQPDAVTDARDVLVATPAGR